MADFPAADVASAAAVDADAFASRLEALASTLPPVLPLSRSLDEDGTAAASRAFDEIVSTSKHTSWYSTGKRHLHQPQLESLAGCVIAPMVQATAKSKPRVLLELGAGRALLGKVVANLTDCSLVAVDRRRNGEEEEARTHHDDGEGAEDDDDDDADDDKDDNSEKNPETDTTIRVTMDLTRETIFSDLLPDTRVKKLAATNGAVVVAKHLCAGATDAALRLCLTGGTKVKAVALTPCCHPQIKWDEYSGRAWLEKEWGGKGNKFTETQFKKMLALVQYSKERLGTSGETLERYHGTSLGKLMNIEGGHVRLRRLGRLARRVIETGRAEALKSGGFEDAKICRYVDANVSPDNLVVIAGSASDIKNVVGGDDKICLSCVPRRGVVAHVNASGGASNGSLSRRFTEYLLETRGDSNTISSVTPTFASRPHGELSQREKKSGEKRARVETDTEKPAANDLLPAVMIAGNPGEILQQLTPVGEDTKFVTQCVGMLCPFDDYLLPEQGVSLGATIEKLVAKVLRIVQETDSIKSIRLSAFPRSLEHTLVEIFADTEIDLHPTQFTHTLTVTQWFSNPDDVGDCANPGEQYGLLWSVLPRSAWDPNGWRQRQSDTKTNEEEKITKASRALFTSLGESACRLPSHLGNDFTMQSRNRTISVVTDDGKEVESALIRWCFETADAAEVVVARPRRTSGKNAEVERWDLYFERIKRPGDDRLMEKSDRVSAHICIFRLGRIWGDITTILSLISNASFSRVKDEIGYGSRYEHVPYLAQNAWFIGPGVRLGRLARHRRVADKVVTTLKENGFHETKVIHLCSDREQERTIVCRKSSTGVE